MPGVNAPAIALETISQGVEREAECLAEADAVGQRAGKQRASHRADAKYHPIGCSDCEPGV
jgi:hypothetical protein